MLACRPYRGLERRFNLDQAVMHLPPLSIGVPPLAPGPRHNGERRFLQRQPSSGFYPGNLLTVGPQGCKHLVRGLLTQARFDDLSGWSLGETL